MSLDPKDNLALKSRLGYLEGWVAHFERNPLNPIELREKTKERGFTDKIASLRDDLIAGWAQLLSPGAAGDAAAGRRAINVDAAMEQLALMRRLLAVEDWLKHAHGESPPPPNSSAAALVVLANDPAGALPTLARTKPSPDFDNDIRRALGSRPARMPFKISRPIMGVLLVSLVLFGAVAAIRAYTGRPDPTSTPTSTATSAAVGVARTTSTRANAVTSIMPTVPGVEEMASVPEAPASTDTPTAVWTSAPVAAPTTVSSTESPTGLPTTIPSATPTNTRRPTPMPTPRPRPAPPPSTRVFVADVQVSFPGLSPSDQRRSCVNGRVVNRDGQGVAGAILRINNGVSQSEAKEANNDGAFEFCGLGASRWSVVLGYVPEPRLDREVVAVIEVSGQEGQFARVLFREKG